MTVEIIDSFPALLELQAEWSRFARTIATVTPFQLPEWLIAWWRHFGSGALHLLAFRVNGDIVGIVPLFLHEWKGARQFTLLGSGISDYLEPAIAPGNCGEVVECLRAHLASKGDWDVCNWQDLSCDTPLRSLASQLLEDTPCSEILLAGTFDDYWSARSKSLRQNVRRDRQKAESRGRLEFQISSDADAESMEALIRLHAARWQSAGEPGMIAANRSAEFLKDVSTEFARGGMLRMFTLRFDGQIAALILAFVYANRIFNYITAFDPEHEALGLGRTLLFEALRYSFENGYEAWDFLRGEEPYKTWWGAQPVCKCRVIVTRTS